ncbi:MAG TPA: phage tail protein [Verrucomicrobiae bacterium]|nr:phage tail protein [Verrucomicrobiae bacterium]
MAGGPTPFVNSFAEPGLGSLRYNTSQYGNPLPLVYGTQRVSVNLLEFWGFEGSNGGGGKGGLTGKSAGGKKGSNFSVYIAMAICQGPVAASGSHFGSRVWANAGIKFGISSVGLNFFSGTDGQLPDSIFVSKDMNTPVLGYSGTAYVTGDPLQLGATPVVPNISFEITGFYAGTCGPNFPDDARPDNIISDFLTNSRYGAGYPGVNIDYTTLGDFGNYCQAANLAMSMLIDRCEPAARTIEYICQASVAAVFFSGGLLKIVPYSIASYAGNDASWSPNVPVRYSLSDHDFLDWGGGSDPVITTRTDPYQATNWYSCEYLDSSNAYNNNIAYAFDQGAIDQYGVRTEASEETHLITNITSAVASAQIQLQRKQLIRNTFKFQLPWIYSLLDPMDVVELTDLNAGLDHTQVRITSISENDDYQLVFEAENLYGVTAPVPSPNTQAPSGTVPNVFAIPPDANPPIIFQAKPPLGGSNFEVWILSSGGAEWGGANVWISTDGSTYNMVGVLFAGARQGLLTAGLASYGGANPDITHTLSVDLTESFGTLMSVSPTDASNFVSLCFCDGELLSYQTATLTTTSNYNLTTLYRGLYGTTGSGHSSGTKFAFLGLSPSPVGVLKYTYPSNLSGVLIYVKIQSFNGFLNETQDLSSLTPTTFTLP